MQVLIFGAGYTGLRLARALQQAHMLMGQDITVAVTSRKAALRRDLISQGLVALPFPLPDCAHTLATTTHIVSTVPPDDSGDPVLTAHAEALRAAPVVRWVGYLSTTGIYGDHQGGWVDETTPPDPSSPRAARRLAAEQAWQQTGLPVTLFRLPGIYGPGRSAFDQLRAGTARRIDRPGHVFSRIHVDDIVGAVLAAMQRQITGALFNLVDDEAAEPRAVTELACALLGMAPPPLTPLDLASLSPMARSFWIDSKRVHNQAMKAQLGYDLHYPTYREGLAAILAEEQKTAPNENRP